jgi:tetratricopeptide (TPR) repeat protein
MARYLAYPGVHALIRIYQGQSVESIRSFTKTAADSVSVDNAALWARVWRAVASVELAAGDPDAAVASIERARLTVRQVAADAELTTMAAVAHARAGRIVAARTAARQHDLLSAQLPGPDTDRRQLLIAAELALALDDPDTAVQHLRDALALLRPGPASPPADEFVRYAFPLARAYLKQGSSASAAELFERIVNSGAQRLHYPYQYVRSFYFLGKIAEEDDDPAAARRYYQRFLDYWGEGDIDLERVEETRAFIEGG